MHVSPLHEIAGIAFKHYVLNHHVLAGFSSVCHILSCTAKCTTTRKCTQRGGLDTALTTLVLPIYLHNQRHYKLVNKLKLIAMNS